MGPRAPAAALAAALLLAAAGPARAGAGSAGTPQDGALVDGFRLPLTGAHHRFYGPVRARGTHYATLEVAALVARAARAVEAAAPGAPLVLGDLSAREGGPLPNHASHESGRDVDLLLYVTDAAGRSVPSPGFWRFDGAGRCADAGCDLRLDVPRTWHLVRTLLASQRPAVQWVFVADPLRDLLLRHAAARGEHPALLRRARDVLRQPTDGAPHDDHLHVRTYCTPRDRLAGCADVGPRWPWVGADGRGRPLRPERGARAGAP